MSNHAARGCWGMMIWNENTIVDSSCALVSLREGVRRDLSTLTRQTPRTKAILPTDQHRLVNRRLCDLVLHRHEVRWRK